MIPESTAALICELRVAEADMVEDRLEWEAGDIDRDDYELSVESFNSTAARLALPLCDAAEHWQREAERLTKQRDERRQRHAQAVFALNHENDLLRDEIERLQAELAARIRKELGE